MFTFDYDSSETYWVLRIFLKICVTSSSSGTYIVCTSRTIFIIDVLKVSSGVQEEVQSGKKKKYSMEARRE